MKELIGRDALMTELWTTLRPDPSSSSTHTLQTQRVAVLHGQSGIGKSELAVHFSRTHRDDFSIVFWVDASTRNSLVQSWARMAYRVPALATFAGVENVEIQARNLLRLIRKMEISGWLLVIDGLDRQDLDAENDPGSERLSLTRLLSIAEFGSVLVTTRVEDVGFGRSFHVAKLSEEDSVRVLASTGGVAMESALDATDKLDLISLTQKLEGLPHVLTLAGAYIVQTGATPREYAELYTKALDDHSPCEPVVPALALAYDNLKTKAPHSAGLFYLFSLLHRENIRYSMLCDGLDPKEEAPAWLREILSSETAFASALEPLVDYSLIERFEELAIRITPAIHTWARTHIQETERKETLAFAIRAVGFSAPPSWDIQSVRPAISLLPHADALYESVKQNPKIWEEAQGEEAATMGDAFGQLAELFFILKRLPEAEFFFQLAIANYTNKFGPEDVSTLEVMFEVSVIYDYQRRFQEAEALQKRILDSSTRVLGPDDRLTTRSMIVIAFAYKRQERYEEAEEMFQKVIATHKRVQGVYSRSALHAMQPLVKLYCTMGQPEKAEELLSAELEHFKTVFGPEYTSVVGDIQRLSVMFRNLATKQEAHELEPGVIAALEKMGRVEHVATYDVVCELGLLYFRLGKLKEAEDTLWVAVAGRELMLGTYHESTSEGMHAIARVHAATGAYRTATNMLDRLIDIRTDMWGPGHDLTLDTHRTLLEVRSMMGEEDAPSVDSSPLDSVNRASGEQGPQSWVLRSRL